MGQLDGKTALVTGATSGIGLASARALAAEGASVFLTGRREQALKEVVADIGSAATGIRADVSDLADLDRVIAAIKESGRDLDILFANAGIAEIAPLGSLSWQHYADTFNTNVGGIVFTVQKALPVLSAAGASVILCGSNVGVKASPGMSLYAATKAAVRSLARSWAAELAERKIRVNVVAPGPTNTPGLNGLVPNAEAVEQLHENLKAGIPMNRLARPEEQAEAVVFLASERSSFMTGAEIYVDGGASQI